MARCTSCNKFVGLDAEREPEPNLDVSEDGTVTGSVEIVNACNECGQDMTGTTFDVEVMFEDANDHKKEKPWDKAESHAYTVEARDANRTDRFGKGRRAAHFYGAELVIELSCECGWSAEQNWSDETKASAMDDLQ